MDDKARMDLKLQAFYDRVPDVQDALPFKEYVLKAEDSRMAWYLLGKQYEARGETGKAAYCFSQAGKIYEAFENQAPPVLPVAAKPERAARRKTSWALRAAMLMLLAAGLALQPRDASAPSSAGEAAPAVLLPAEKAADAPSETAAERKAADAGPRHAAAAQRSRPDGAGAEGRTGYDLIAGAAQPDEVGHAFAMAFTSGEGRQSALMVRSPLLGAWTDWLKSGAPVASAYAGAKAGEVVLQWHDPEWCACEAAGGEEARRAAAAWKSVQEMKLALRSAIYHYRNMNGRWPRAPEDLAGAYPLNLMAGWTDEMTVWFAELTEGLRLRDGADALGWPQGPEPGVGRAVPAGTLAVLAEKPLEIIVDKANHRLAVVSGNVLIRNYEVGLGGDKTPEGTFYISEKVRNPNGKPDGAFGSRGMTLSGTLYAIHGTNEPESIGKDESLGCIRMAREDLEELYDLVPIGTAVTITKGVLPPDIRVPAERFRLPAVQDETNPHKVYQWLH